MDTLYFLLEKYINSLLSNTFIDWDKWQKASQLSLLKAFSNMFERKLESQSCVWLTAHSSEIGGLCLMKCSSKTHQNLPYFWSEYKNPHSFFLLLISCYFIFSLMNALALSRNKRFILNFVPNKNTSKFATLLEYENPQPNLSLKILGWTAKLAEGDKNGRQLLIKKKLSTSGKLDQKTKVVYYFDNSNGIFFRGQNIKGLA